MGRTTRRAIGSYCVIVSKSALVVLRVLKCLVCIIVALVYVRCLASAIEKAMKVQLVFILLTR